MSFCEECGAKLAPGAAFCEECGATVKKSNIASEAKSSGRGEAAAFCEECGAPLASGSTFCEECGAQVASVREGASSSKLTEPLPRVEGDDGNADLSGFEPGDGILAKENWEELWKAAVENAHGNEVGLVVTNLPALCDDVCHGECDDEYINDFFDYFRAFSEAAAKRGVRYYLFNFGWPCPLTDWREVGNDLESVIAVLRKIVNVARPKYLFILGGENVVPVAEWTNEAGDQDETVLSDLPYVTLDTTSPWEGQKFSFKNCLRVGRMPSFPIEVGEDFDPVMTYLGTTSKGIGHFGEIVPYGLSAQVWKDESNDEFSAVSTGSVEVSPQVTNENVSIPENANLLFFNLHGSDEDCHWFGQDHNSFPEAFSPDKLQSAFSTDGYDEMPRPFIIAVEACYGARYTGGLAPEESLLLTAMQSGCVAFLGSSKIAYGTAAPKGSSADTLVGNFIKRVANGDTVGDAYISGIDLLVAEAEDPNGGSEVAIKTIAEFALYGDPSACVGKNKNVGAVKKLMKALGGVPKGIHIAMPDIRRASKMALAEVDKKIEAVIDDFAMRELGIISGSKAAGMVKAKTFTMPSRGINLKAYDVGSGVKQRQLRVYFNNAGKVTKALHSK